MAIAGKVAITPKGDWNNIETYDKLDLVKYNNSLYIAKKSNQNIIPEDGDIWMLAVKSYDEEEFNKLITDVDDINRNLDIQGLLDKFDGKLDQAYYDVNNGTKAVHSDFVCNTNPISCNSGDSINFKLGIKPKNGLQIIYFNESGYVSGVTKYGTDLTFTAPSGATYFHFNYARSGGVTPTSAGSISVFINNEIEETNASLTKLELSDVAGGKNIANPYNFEDGKVVDYNSGAISDNSLYFVTGYIDVEPSTKYTKQGFSSGAENWYYDENKNAISIITTDTFTTPSNAKYVVLSGLIRNKSICMLEKGSTPTTYEPYIPSVKMLASEVDNLKNDLSNFMVNTIAVVPEASITNFNYYLITMFNSTHLYCRFRTTSEIPQWQQLYRYISKLSSLITENTNVYLKDVQGLITEYTVQLHTAGFIQSGTNLPSDRTFIIDYWF